jgi:hypothetical protein
MKQPYSLVAPSDVAVRFYRLLLRLYPPHFRKEYGGAMTLLFRDCLRDARHEGEQMVLQLWLATLFDTCVSAPRAHLEEWTAMQASYTRSSQIGAICAFVAVILWAITFTVGDVFTAFGTIIASLSIALLVVATFGAVAGLYYRLSATHRSPFTIAGAVCGIVGLLMGLASVVGFMTDTNLNDDGWAWPVGMLGLGTLTLAFALLGVTSSTQATLGPLRFAPLLLWGFPIAVVMLLFFYSTFGEGGQELVTVLQLIALAGLLGTGALLWTKSK